MYSESHCHLGAATPETLKKAAETGFDMLLDAGIDLASCESAVSLAEKHRIVYACLGIHPWYADEWSGDVAERFRILAKNPKVVAVSEVGLDFVGRMNKEWIREDRIIDKEVQRAALRDQIRLAGELKLPVIVHDRAPGVEVLDILEEEGALARGAAIHGFNKDAAYVKRAASLGVYLSVGRGVVNNPTPGFLEAVKAIPLDLLLTETDGGSPENLLPVCEAVGRVKGLSREEIGYGATANLRRLLGR